MTGVRIHVGRFDPKFVGVTIRATGPNDVHSFRLTDRNRQPPVAILESLPADELVSDLSRLSVLVHEQRHVHDALLFPFGEVTSRLRINGALNGFMVAMALKRNAARADTVFVPLQRWMRLPADERTGIRAQAEALMGRPVRAPDLPVFDPEMVRGRPAGSIETSGDEETIELGAQVALTDYELVERLWRSPHDIDEAATAPAIVIWEAAAYLCQVATVERLGGHRLAVRYQGWVAESGPRVYQVGLRVLAHTAHLLGWSTTARNLLVLATWSQMGEFRTEMLESSPTARLAALARAAQQGAWWSDDSTFVDLVEGWDGVTGTDSLGAVRAPRWDFSRFDHPFLQPELFTALMAMRSEVLDAFLEDPDRYVDPARYEISDAYPRPCVAVTYPDVDSSLAEWVDATPPEWEPLVTTDAMRRLAVIAELSDALFLPGEKSLSSTGRATIQEWLELSAYRIMS